MNIFGSIKKLYKYKGSFLYILRSCLKVKVQNLDIFLDANISFFLGGGGGEGGGKQKMLGSWVQAYV